MACLTTAKQQVLQSTTFHSGWLKTILTCFLGTSASDCRAVHLSSMSYLRVSKPGYGLPHNSQAVSTGKKPFSPASWGLLLLIAGQSTCLLHLTLGFQSQAMACLTTAKQYGQKPVSLALASWGLLLLIAGQSTSPRSLTGPLRFQSQAMACLTTAKQFLLASWGILLLITEYSELS